MNNATLSKTKSMLRLSQTPKVNKQQTRSVLQGLWRDPALPYAELRYTYDSKLSYKKHSHAQLSIGYILSGTTATQYQGKTWQVNQGQVILIDPEQVHSCNAVAQQPRSYCMLYLDKAWCLQQLSAIYAQQVDDFYCESVVFEDIFIEHKLQQLMQAVSFKTATQHQIRQLIEQVAMQVLASYCCINVNSSPLTSLVVEVRAHLLSHLERPDLLSTLASQFSTTQETIIRAFTKQLGISPKAYLNNVRIEKSKLLLQQGATVVDVALQLGFSDQSHFHKTFNQYCAMTPKQYQQINFIQ